MDAVRNALRAGCEIHVEACPVEVMATDEAIGDGDRFATDRDGFAAMLRYAHGGPSSRPARRASAGARRRHPLVDGPARLTGAGS